MATIAESTYSSVKNELNETFNYTIGPCSICSKMRGSEWGK
jgi:hypothetical protein